MRSEEEWNNKFSDEIYSTSSSPDEEANNFMAQLLLATSSSLPTDTQCHWPLQESPKINLTSIYSSTSEGSSTNGSFHFLHSSSWGYDHEVLEAENSAKSSMHYCFDIETERQEIDNMMEAAGDDFLLMNEDDLCNDGNIIMESNEMKHLHIRAAYDDEMKIPVNNNNGNHQSRSPSFNKRRISGPIHNDCPKDMRQPLHQKVASSNEEEDDRKIINKDFKRQNTMITCSSTDEDDSNAPSRCSSKRGGPIPNSNGKTRASRGSATDPQSLYARKRRERINERLKILQNLVPNGTKVDISTMLEEAVQYVKFLQLQIKLLSSDDLWMYSPIAYNGMDMGLDFKIGTA